jgi:hypothetical protein
MLSRDVVERLMRPDSLLNLGTARDPDFVSET